MKPDNLFICESGVVKLSDFGLAERYYTRDVDQSTTRVISLCMAPEVFTDGVVLKSDVW